MKKIIIKNCEDGKESNCFLTGTNFKTARGIAFTLNDKVIDPGFALKNTSYDIEFDSTFVVPSNFNSRIKVGEYLTGLGIGRNHRSYFPLLAKLSENLPIGEYPKYEKQDHS